MDGRHGLRRAHPWQSQKFEYVADRKDIKEVLRDLGPASM